MKTQEMIDVMAAEIRGETIQFRGCSLDDAHDPWQIKSPTYRWDFVIYTYRIAKPEPKKVKMWQWIYRNPFGDGYYLTLKFYPEDAIVDVDPQLVLIKRAEFTMIEVEE